MAHVSGCWWLLAWKKLDQEWQATTTRAQQQLMKIADSIQKTTYLNGEHWGALADCTMLHDRASARLWELAHRCQKRLETEIDSLGDIYTRMSGLMDEYDDGKSSRKLDPRTRQRYEFFLLEILEMYERELVAKALIVSDILECTKHDVMTMYIASWQMQPHIDRLRLEELEKLIQNDFHYSR